MDGKKVQKKRGSSRASLGSLSESVAVFDSERLRPINESLSDKLVPIAADKRLKDIEQSLTLVDGNIVEAMPRIAVASFQDAQAGSGNKMKWTRHTHFELDRSVPTTMEVTPAACGEYDEGAVMHRQIESDRTYVMDRGDANFQLFNRIVDAGSSHDCRICHNSVFTILEETPLMEEDRNARVLLDQIIFAGQWEVSQQTESCGAPDCDRSEAGPEAAQRLLTTSLTITRITHGQKLGARQPQA